MGVSATIENWLTFAGTIPALLPLAIVLATFVLEDATTIIVGVLAADGHISITEGLAALYAGIVLGDLGLYALGRLAASHRWAERFVEHDAVAPFRFWLESRLILTVFTVRFVPGLRLPTYTASGFFRMPFRRFAVSVVAATTVWTTLLFAASYFLGALTADTLGTWRWPLGIGLAAAIFLVARSNARKRGLPDIKARRTAPSNGSVVAGVRAEPPHSDAAGMPPLNFDKRVLSSFETAPPFFFYIPVAAYWFWQSVRHLSFTLPTLANPAIEAGGLCGESKVEVLGLLGQEGRALLAPFVTLVAGQTGNDAEEALGMLDAARIDFPVVAKPDVSRRGTGVRLIANTTELKRYLDRFPRGSRLLVQRYVPFEGEAGIFYVRRPGEERGRVTSLTLKYFPHVVGDGHSTLRELVLSDPRAGRVPQLYLPRLSADLDKVLAAGERYRLVFVGNHCRGAVFRNGAAFVTDAMTNRFDRIAREMEDFHFGRFDIRFASFEALQRGEDFAIIEVNGAGGEATHIWDADMTLSGAYRALFTQVRTAFEIGAAIRERGLKPMSPLKLLRLYYSELGMMHKYPVDTTG